MLNRYLATLLFAMAIIAVVPAPTSAQLSCGWCVEETFGGWHPVIHGFPNGADECGWDGRETATSCSRCGGTSGCHGLYDPKLSAGPCHIQCGPEGGDGLGGEEPTLAQAISTIQGGLDAENLEVVAAMVLDGTDDLSIEYLPESGRIEMLLSCDRTTPAHTIPVPPGVRKALDAEIAAASQQVATASW